MTEKNKEIFELIKEYKIEPSKQLFTEDSLNDEILEWFENIKVDLIDFISSSLQLKEKETITFKEFEKALTKRTFENETFYETEQGLKTIEEISVIYDLYVENL